MRHELVNIYTYFYFIQINMKRLNREYITNIFFLTKEYPTNFFLTKEYLTNLSLIQEILTQRPDSYFVQKDSKYTSVLYIFVLRGTI